MKPYLLCVVAMIAVQSASAREICGDWVSDTAEPMLGGFAVTADPGTGMALGLRYYDDCYSPVLNLLSTPGPDAIDSASLLVDGELVEQHQYQPLVGGDATTGAWALLSEESVDALKLGRTATLIMSGGDTLIGRARFSLRGSATCIENARAACVRDLGANVRRISALSPRETGGGAVAQADQAGATAADDDQAAPAQEEEPRPSPEELDAAVQMDDWSCGEWLWARLTYRGYFPFAGTASIENVVSGSEPQAFAVRLEYRDCASPRFVVETPNGARVTSGTLFIDRVSFGNTAYTPNATGEESWTALSDEALSALKTGASALLLTDRGTLAFTLIGSAQCMAQAQAHCVSAAGADGRDESAADRSGDHGEGGVALQDGDTVTPSDAPTPERPTAQEPGVAASDGALITLNRGWTEAEGREPAGVFFARKFGVFEYQDTVLLRNAINFACHENTSPVFVFDLPEQLNADLLKAAHLGQLDTSEPITLSAPGRSIRPFALLTDDGLVIQRPEFDRTLREIFEVIYAGEVSPEGFELAFHTEAVPHIRYAAASTMETDSGILKAIEENHGSRLRKLSLEDISEGCGEAIGTETLRYTLLPQGGMRLWMGTGVKSLDEPR